MGKSSVSNVFKSLHYPVFDADQAVHALCAPGGGAVNEIQALFASTATAGSDSRPTAVTADASTSSTPTYIEPAAEAVPPLPPVVAADGSIDRQALSLHLIAAPEKLAQLEHVVHPLVLQMRMRWYDKACADGKRLVLYDLPLLFENPNPADKFDYILCVNCDEAKQEKRVLDR